MLRLKSDCFCSLSFNQFWVLCKCDRKFFQLLMNGSVIKILVLPKYVLHGNSHQKSYRRGFVCLFVVLFWVWFCCFKFILWWHYLWWCHDSEQRVYWCKLCYSQQCFLLLQTVDTFYAETKRVESAVKPEWSIPFYRCRWFNWFLSSKTIRMVINVQNV